MKSFRLNLVIAAILFSACVPHAAMAAMGAIVDTSTAQRAANERAASQARTSACYNVQDADARTMCLARAHREPSQCYNIKRADLRQQCLAEVVR